LRPATREEFGTELTACLALVAPVGMDQEARREWLAVAWATLQHLPADMLAYGCKKARETADHPSKIVPTIMAETRDWYKTRQNIAAPIDCLMIAAPTEEPKPEEPMTAEDIAEANILFKRMGLKTRYREDGTAYELKLGEPDPVQPSEPEA
jgi:hypothetical protein